MTADEIKNGLYRISQNSQSKGKLCAEALIYIDGLEQKLKVIEKKETPKEVVIRNDYAYCPDCGDPQDGAEK